jgi:hypothetical protein
MPTYEKDNDGPPTTGRLRMPSKMKFNPKALKNQVSTPSFARINFHA